MTRRTLAVRTRRWLVELREEAIVVGLWVMVCSAAYGFSQLAAAIVHH